MKLRHLLGMLAASAMLVDSARAVTVAGWDFSQYFGENLLTTNGSSGADTLPANYSNLDPTFSAGAESAAYGTMFINGLHGSTAVDPFGATPEIVPVFPSLSANLDAPVGGAAGAVPFDTLNVQIAEGQMFANTLGMLAQAPVSMVFQASLLSSPQQGEGWGLTFGGKTLTGTSVVGVSYSLDGISYGAIQNVNLDTNDTPFSVSFGDITAETIYVRLNLSPANGAPIIDNVSLNARLISDPVPEPATAVLLGAGLALAGALRRRSA